MKTFEIETPDGRVGTATVKLHKIGTQRPYFSVTGELWDSRRHRERRPRDPSICGCIHGEISAARPDLADVVRMHMADADDVPMHAYRSGWYWLAGACGGFGDTYHGGNGAYGRPPEECLRLFAAHVRLPIDEARQVAARVTADVAADRDGAADRFARWIADQLPRWKAEAEAVIEKYGLTVVS